MRNWEENYILIDENVFFQKLSFTWKGWSMCGFRGEIKPYWIEPNRQELKEDFFESKKIGWFIIGPITIHIDTGRRRIFKKKEQAT